MNESRVLVVDDEVDFASTLAERLQLRGYRAEAVFSPEDAVAVIKERPFDILLLDLKMPGMSGIDLLRVARGLLPDVEVILLTGHLDLEAVLEQVPEEHFDYILKPIDIKVLLEKVERARARRTGG